MQATRPQTLAYSLTDSPVGQLAWIVEKFHEWTDPANELPDQAVDRDQLLTNVSVYWFTASGASSAHATYEGMQAWKQMEAAAGDHGGRRGGGPAGPPMGVAVFAADTTIRSIMDPGGDVRPLDRVRPGRALPGDGGPRPPGRRPPHLLPPLTTCKGPCYASGAV